MIPVSKRGAEIALNLIIVAAIGLLVLALIIFIFGGKLTIFSKGVSTCESLNGECSETPCLQLVPPRPAIGGECRPDSEAKYCCSKALS